MKTDAVTFEARQHLAAGRLDAAIALLEKAQHEGTLGSDGRRTLCQSLVQQGKLNSAIDCQKALLKPNLGQADQQERDDAFALAQMMQMAMYYEDATRIARELVARDAGDAGAIQLLSTLTLWLDGPEAAAAIIGDNADWSEMPAQLLCESLAFRADPDPVLVERVERLAEDPSQEPQKRADLLMALAQHCDRIGDYERAWDLAAQGNAIAPARQRQDWRSLLKIHRDIYHSVDDCSDRDLPRHCYLLGTPRSGQSLMQSILAASPDAMSLGERGALLQHILYRSGEIVRMPPAERANFYTQLAQADDNGLVRMVGTPALVVDKSPLHLPVAGSVARIHPSAKLGAALRDPADTAMSIWLRSFPPVYDYANDMAAILEHLDFALDAIAAWRGDGLKIELFDHALLIGQPEAASEAMFDWLGLEWDPGYLDPGQRTAPVATFSAAQVREAISPAVARGAAPYADRLAPFAERLESLRKKTADLLAAREG